MNNQVNKVNKKFLELLYKKVSQNWLNQCRLRGSFPRSRLFCAQIVELCSLAADFNGRSSDKFRDDCPSHTRQTNPQRPILNGNIIYFLS